jgi:hypothetical protein
MEKTDMIGIWAANANIFLYVIGVASLLFFGLPILVTPLGWARAMRWDIPQQRDLAMLLGRSLGLIISTIAIFAFRVTQIPVAKPFFFDLILCIFVEMFLLHVFGAVRKAQPITETFEIILWAVLSLLTLGFYPI